eukprot:CAMPEP_0179149652 /NCGR_PEP_ID=MMETSP0796-20121207/72516_1 /TAXON_ID=73915 /ORGANISM="Pyrodinium bahamense, Strain pbaha01" /LENGTH=399 /DNA_ID=CAMNT_0020850521 /DNA_START=164 /DNA_END=1360 /DNA_ORIENTATION=+
MAAPTPHAMARCWGIIPASGSPPQKQAGSSAPAGRGSSSEVLATTAEIEHLLLGVVFLLRGVRLSPTCEGKVCALFHTIAPSISSARGQQLHGVAPLVQDGQWEQGLRARREVLAAQLARGLAVHGEAQRLLAKIELHTDDVAGPPGAQRLAHAPAAGVGAVHHGAVGVAPDVGALVGEAPKVAPQQRRAVVRDPHAQLIAHGADTHAPAHHAGAEARTAEGEGHVGVAPPLRAPAGGGAAAAAGTAVLCVQGRVDHLVPGDRAVPEEGVAREEPACLAPAGGHAAAAAEAARVLAVTGAGGVHGARRRQRPAVGAACTPDHRVEGSAGNDAPPLWARRAEADQEVLVGQERQQQVHHPDVPEQVQQALQQGVHLHRTGLVRPPHHCSDGVGHGVPAGD